MARSKISGIRREQIVDALFKTLVENGYESATSGEVAARLGISRNALHYYFRHRHEMERMLVERVGGAYVKNLTAYVEKGEPGAARLDRFFRFHTGGDAAVMAQLMSIWVTFWGQAPRDAAMRATFTGIQDALRAILAANAAMAQVGRAPATDPDVFAVVGLGLIEGVLLQWLLGRDRVDLRASFELARTAALKLAGIEATAP